MTRSSSVPEADRWYIRSFYIKCSPDDANKLELDGLELIILDTSNISLSLFRLSEEVWRLRARFVNIPIPPQGLFLVASSANFGDIGYIQLDVNDLSAKQMIGGPQRGIDLERKLEPCEAAPKLRILLGLYQNNDNEEESDDLEVDFWKRNPSLLHSMTRTHPNGHPKKATRLNVCGDLYLKRFKTTQDQVDVQGAITAYAHAIDCLPFEDARLSSFVEHLGFAHYTSYDRFGQIADLNEAITKQRMALELTMEENDENLRRQLNNLGSSLRTRFQRLGDMKDLAESIRLLEIVIQLTLEGDPDLPGMLNNLGNSFTCRFERTGELADISKSIQLKQRAVQLTPEGHPNLPILLSNLGNSFTLPFERTGELADISESIQLKQRAVQLSPKGHPDLPSRLNNLGNSFAHRFERTGEMADISESIQLLQRAVKLTPEGHPDLPSRLSNLGSSFTCRFERMGELADISESIQLQQRAVKLTPEGHPHLPSRLNNLGNSFTHRFGRTGELADISSSIQLQQRAVQLTPEGHPNLPSMFNSLGDSFARRFKRTGELADISESIQLLQRAVKLTPEGHPHLPSRLSNLGSSFTCRFGRTGELADISESIQLQQRAVQLTPEGHPHLPSRLNNLGNSFTHRFERTGEIADISESIQLQQRAVQLTPEGHPHLPSRLNNLGNSFTHRFKRTGEIADISESIQLQQRAVQLTPEGHPHLPSRLNNLAASFTSRYERTGELAGISESIQLQQRAVQLTPEGHPDLPCMLNTLGNSFSRRFERTGELADISESIQLKQRAVQLTPEGHADLPRRLNNLGNSFTYRFERTGELADISESIQLQQRAVKLTPEGHRDLPGLLSNLGSSLGLSFERTGEPADVSESIQLLQRAVQLTPENHPDLPSWLNNLGASFAHRFERIGEQADILESIQLRQRAVQLTPEGHANLPSWLNNLGASFAHRFERIGEQADILESIQLRQRAVQLTPEGHADLPSRLYDLGNSFLHHSRVSQNLSSYYSALSLFRQAAHSSNGSLSTILNAAQQWAILAPSISEKLDAHGRAIHLLTLMTGLENTLQHRHYLLIKSSKLSTTAAAAALSANMLDKALEWLEQGRCIVWNQLNQLRGPIDDLRFHHPELAHQLSALSQQLENIGSRSDPRHPDVQLSIDASISLENEARNHFKLARQRDDLLATIRSQASFENFLQPLRCTDLMSRLPRDGSVVIINASKKHCDALALVATLDEPIHIPLERFSYEKAETLARTLRKYLSSPRLRTRYYSEETEPDLRGCMPAKPSSKLLELLKTLWIDLVQPILQSLAISTTQDDHSKLPRIWWCPTGPFAFLPIHAAGNYKDGKDAPGRCLNDLAVSSYIPNLTTLDRLKSRKNTACATDSGILLVSQPDTPGMTRLPCTGEEVRKIVEIFSERRIKSEELKSRDATVASTERSLESYSSIHLACHASQDVDKPLESAVHLYDGTLKLTEIMKKNLPNAELAFMSACQTSTGDEKLPEEAVHLAAGMLAAGYRSVVATMWSISDEHAPLVAERFYESLLSRNLSEGRSGLDGSEAARALHVAVRCLRERLERVHMSEEQKLLTWIPYVHFGI